ncbi:putative dynein heavy chain [Trypanosoma cruzi]|uniref:Putative dynein heavy chain n=1 Tax=Trypanosoma cruzi TaxID=5693 RepID=A0A2V2VB11_TRYCR|nr:putative dynein heavy chain [Trypanosoma cruzi]
MWASLIELMPRSGKAATLGGESREDVLLKLTDEILSQLPEPLDRKRIMRKEKERANEMGHSNLQPTQVVLLQEIERWNRLVGVMIISLKELQKALSGAIGMSNDLDDLASSLHNGQLPWSWRKMAPATRKNLGRWLAHFHLRCKQYNEWAMNGEPRCMWMSGLMVPESYISALVQVVCRRYKWPLDRSSVVTKVTTYMTPQEIQERPKDGAYVSGLFIEGARWDTSRRCLAPQRKKELITEMPVMHIIPTESSKVKSVATFRTPVYVTSDRRNAAGVGLIFEADLSTDAHSSLWTLESVALILDSDD